MLTFEHLYIFFEACKKKKFRSIQNEIFSKIKYYNGCYFFILSIILKIYVIYYILGFNFDQLETEIAFKMIILSDLRNEPAANQEYVRFVKKQLAEITDIWEKMIEEENKETQTDLSQYKFAGIPSYDMKVS